jgi:peptidoglycan/xylan/chitin deacetylase (PgdA/CDA1 family)
MSARSVAGRAARAVGVDRSVIRKAHAHVERGVIAVRRHRGAPPRNRILCYHSVGTPEWGINDVSPARFRRQLESALDAGYTFVPAEQVSQHPANGERCLAVTFDDGLRSCAMSAWPILADLAIPWTIFIVSAWAEGKHELGPELFLDWRDVEKLAQAGVTIGSHSVTHPDFGRLDARAATSELFESREMIRRRTGIDVDEFAIPFGLAKNWTTMAAEAAREVGYTRVYAQADELRPPDTEPRTFITNVDGQLIFRAALDGAFDWWEEPSWY